MMMSTSRWYSFLAAITFRTTEWRTATIFHFAPPTNNIIKCNCVFLLANAPSAWDKKLCVNFAGGSPTETRRFKLANYLLIIIIITVYCFWSISHSIFQKRNKNYVELLSQLFCNSWNDDNDERYSCGCSAYVGRVRIWGSNLFGAQARMKSGRARVSVCIFGATHSLRFNKSSYMSTHSQFNHGSLNHLGGTGTALRTDAPMWTKKKPKTNITVLNSLTTKAASLFVPSLVFR